MSLAGRLTSPRVSSERRSDQVREIWLSKQAKADIDVLDARRQEELYWKDTR